MTKEEESKPAYMVSKDKLELKHLAPYLPYGLNVKLEFMEDSNIPWYYEDKEIFILEGMMLDWWNSDGKRDITKITPILRPLSDFNDSEADKEIFETGNYYTSVKLNSCMDLPYWETQILLKYHFDVFGLIDKGLALSSIDTKDDRISELENALNIMVCGYYDELSEENLLKCESILKKNSLFK